MPYPWTKQGYGLELGLGLGDNGYNRSYRYNPAPIVFMIGVVILLVGCAAVPAATVVGCGVLRLIGVK